LEEKVRTGKGENGSFLLLRKGIGKPEGLPKRRPKADDFE